MSTIYDDDTDLEDELEDVTSSFVVDTLGFDPREFDEEPKSLSQQIAILLAEPCGANAPGGGGFQKGNTCQKKGSGKGDDDWEDAIGEQQIAAVSDDPDEIDEVFGTGNQYVDEFYELEKDEWKKIAKEIGVEWDDDEGFLVNKYTEYRQKQDDKEEAKDARKIQKPKDAGGNLQSNRREYREALEDLGMMDLSIDEVAELAGQMDGVDTEVYAQEEVIDPDDEEVLQPAGIQLSTEDAAYQSERMITEDEDGDTIIDNQYFMVEAGRQGQGLGTRIFARQVRAAQDAGISAIKTGAARGATMNGYYTWPRLGYDSDLSDQRESVRSIFRKYDSSFTKVSDIMRTQEGRDYWKENGIGLNLEFDLTKGSLSMRRLRHYLEQKGIEL